MNTNEIITYDEMKVFLGTLARMNMEDLEAVEKTIQMLKRQKLYAVNGDYKAWTPFFAGSLIFQSIGSFRNWREVN